MLRPVHLIVRRLIVHVTAKIVLPQPSIGTRLRVVILQIVASVVLLNVKIAHRRGTVLIVPPSMIAQIAVDVRSVTVIRVLVGALMIAARRVVTMLMLHLRNVANSHRVLNAPTAPVMTICRFSARLAQTQRHGVHAPSSRMTIALSVVATSPQARL